MMKMKRLFGFSFARKIDRRRFLKATVIAHSVPLSLASVHPNTSLQSKEGCQRSSAARGNGTSESTDSAELTLYVAPSGRDEWSGSHPVPNQDGSDGPLASLEGARNAIRRARSSAETQGSIKVVLREGKYFLQGIFWLKEEDGGSAEFPLEFVAYPGENPILSGGRIITGWKPYKGPIWRAPLPEARGGNWRFRQLFFEGKRQPQARFPKADPQDPRNSGYLKSGEAVENQELQAFTYPAQSFPRRWARPSQGEVHIRAGWWNEEIVPIKSVDQDRRVITLRYPILDADVAPWFMRFRRLGPGFPFYVANLLEELTEPGEWCLDSSEGAVYFWPPHGNPNSSEVVIPTLKTLISLRDVSWLRISGLTFTETLGGDNYHRSELKGYGAMFPLPERSYVGEAIRMRGTQHCVVEQNHFDQVGGNAVYLEHNNSRNIIRRNEIRYSGANGICLLGVKARHPRLNRIEDNHIHDCGEINNYCAGIFLGLSDSNVIGHNAIHDTPHHGINLGSNGFGRNIVEFNDIRRTCLENRDLGAINCWMDVPRHYVEANEQRSGHVIRFNYIAETGGGGVGIYLDDFSSNCLVLGNIVVGASSGVLIHSGRHNVVDNNIFVDCRHQIWLANAASYRAGNEPFVDFWVGNSFTRNICYFSDPESWLAVMHVYREKDRAIWVLALAQMDENIYFGKGRTEYRSAIHSGIKLDNPTVIKLVDWKKQGYDENSIIADPKFEDPANRNYRLKPESPALALGFLPIDPDRIGVRKSRGD
jgi:parallel beta-helix repeat protein